MDVSTRNLMSISVVLGLILTVVLGGVIDLSPAAEGSAQPLRGTNDAIYRVSVASDGSQANGWAAQASISADGRYVAFTSDASNLVTNDTNDAEDTFVHDRVTGNTTRVSVTSDGSQSNGASYVSSTSTSGDGRYIAFDSYASNLVSGDTNNARDVFVHDRQMRTTERVSLTSEGNQGNGHSLHPSISADGRYVAFWSLAPNLVSGDTNNAIDIFVYDRQTHATKRVSIRSDGGQGNESSTIPCISPSGRYVGFVSYASNLVNGDTNNARDVFVHDQLTHLTERVSIASDGSQGDGASSKPSISAGGRYVAFESEASNLVDGDTNGAEDIFVRDRRAGQTFRVSVSSDGAQANRTSSAPSISTDGRYVAFSSYANLAGGEPFRAANIFVHDRQVHTTERVSVQGNHPSRDPSISRKGRYVAFESKASDLIDGDTNDACDVFVYDPGDGSISGHIHGSGGNPIPDVTVSTGAGQSATTDDEGVYTITGLVAGAYAVTPEKTGWTFTPLTRIVHVPPDAFGQDFTMLHPPVSTTLTLSGTISVPISLSYMDTQGLSTTLDFPSGAVTKRTTVVLTPMMATDNIDLAFAGHAFELGAYQDGVRQPSMTLDEPMTATVRYSAQDVRLISDQSQLTLRWWDGTAWLDATETCDPPSLYLRDEVGHLLSVSICHLSRFALLGPTNRVCLPLLFREG